MKHDISRPAELTEKTIQAAVSGHSGGRIELADAREAGLRLRIGAAKATWSLLVRDGGGERIRLPLGQWPDLTLEGAREAARAQRGRRTGQGGSTLKSVDELLTAYETHKASQLKRWRSTMNSLRNACASILYRDPLTLTTREISEIVRAKSLAAPSHANRQLAYMRAMFGWGCNQGLLRHNPAKGIQKPSREFSRERTPSLDEIRLIWKTCDGIGYPYGCIVQMLILTACRLEEVAGMRRSELQLPKGQTTGRWTIPAARSKNGRSISIPLSAQARAVIEHAGFLATTSGATGAGDEYVFSLSDRPFSGWSNAKKGLDRQLGHWSTSIEPWTVHDLRRSFATYACDELDIPHHVADRCLNHVGTASRSTVSRVYDRSQLYNQRADALARWATLLDIDRPLERISACGPWKAPIERSRLDILYDQVQAALAAQKAAEAAKETSTEHKSDVARSEPEPPTPPLPIPEPKPAPEANEPVPPLTVERTTCTIERFVPGRDGPVVLSMKAPGVDYLDWRMLLGRDRDGGVRVRGEVKDMAWLMSTDDITELISRAQKRGLTSAPTPDLPDDGYVVRLTTKHEVLPPAKSRAGRPRQSGAFETCIASSQLGPGALKTPMVEPPGLTGCRCERGDAPHTVFETTPVGVDDTEGRFADVTVQRCRDCERYWLRYQVEYEAFSRSGRWARGLIDRPTLKLIAPEAAVGHLHGLDAYLYGGSRFDGEWGWKSGPMGWGIS